jgi:signal transduction histidine kinase
VSRLAASWRPRYGRAWRDTVFVTAGAALHGAAWLTTGLLLAATVLLAPTGVLAAVTAVPLLAAVQLFSGAQRRRCRAVLGVVVPAAAVFGRGAGWRGLLGPLRAAATWRQLAYHGLVAPLAALAGLAVLAGWAVGCALAAVFGYGWALPAGTVLSAASHPARDTVLTAAGAVALLATPALAAAVRAADVRAASRLLAPSRTSALQLRVDDLTESRAGVVDAGDAERRRIERDLHDGVQQYLVSLALNLGMLRVSGPDLPAPARQAVAEAHDEAKEALAALRALVRGLHPPVLDTLGLDAALAAAAARVPLPVRVRVDVPVRPAPAVEAVAYFVVCEALANAVRHAGASRAEVTVRRRGDRLDVLVVDDGTGGARVTGGTGTGLTGLRQRVRSVDGTLHVDSPVGGPTRLAAELPCAP